MVAIFVLLALLAIAGTGWLKAAFQPPPEKIPYENTYRWTEIFRGYEAYLDRRIHRATMQTASMAPTINVGDTVLWVEVDNKANLGVDDIIIFEHPTRPVDNMCHRIISIKKTNGLKFETMGDNSQEPDPLVPEELVRGLVIGVIYNAGPG